MLRTAVACREHGMSSASSYKWEMWWHGCLDDIGVEELSVENPSLGQARASFASCNSMISWFLHRKSV